MIHVTIYSHTCFHIWAYICVATTSYIPSITRDSAGDKACNNQPYECKELPISLSLLYHNLQTTGTNKIKSLSLLQNLMGFLQEFTEMAYHIQS